MSLFDTLIVQPIFNLLIAIYGILPGSDFGVALIIFTVIVRLVMWPLVKKQLHQTKVMRAIQPELKKIKSKAKGNRQLEAQMMMELYRERGVSPFGSIGLLLIQLPIFIALFRVIQIMTIHRDQIATFTYDFLERLGPVHAIIVDANHQFNESLLGIINLTKHAVGSEGIYLPLLLLAAIASVLQYIQSKQTTPIPTEQKRLRDIMKESATGKQADQAEISAAMSQNMIKIFPFITFFVAIYLPGALVLYYAASSGVAVIQQKIVLGRDIEEMENLADSAETPKKKSRKPATPQTATAEQRASTANEAEVVSDAPTPTQKAHKPNTRKSGRKKKGRR